MYASRNNDYRLREDIVNKFSPTFREQLKRNEQSALFVFDELVKNSPPEFIIEQLLNAIQVQEALIVRLRKANLPMPDIRLDKQATESLLRDLELKTK
jgi:hypothetical protein